jgi:N-acetylmuramoyl-L-alanine amidase
MAGIVVANTITSRPLNVYKIPEPEKVYKVLIVPGHDSRNSSEGCKGRAGKEADIVAAIGSDLEDILIDNSTNLSITSIRNKKEYDKDFMNYLESNFNKLRGYIYKKPKSHKFKINKLDYPIMLYGIADYANKKEYDLMVNLHMNNLQNRHELYRSGYAIYYSHLNAHKRDSKELANFISDELKKDFTRSNNFGERAVNEKSSFILLGNHRIGLKVPSVIVECGYIDEAKFSRDDIQKKAAIAISNGIKDYIQHKQNLK